jgi:nicotinamidase-related amidase
MNWAANCPHGPAFGKGGMPVSENYVAADPYPWPFDGDLRPANTALVIIDMQTDFCGVGGYVDRMGYDLSLTRAPIEPIAVMLAAMRQHGFHVFYTREGHRPDLSDLPANKRWRLAPDRRRHRRSRPVRPHIGARRAGLGDHPRACVTGQRADHRQARQRHLFRRYWT